MSIIHDPALYQLRHALRGHVFDPGEPEYEDACTLFNGRIERRPRHVARCSHPHQVSAALAFARTRGLRVAVRAGGHSVAGLSLVDDGLVIDVRGLRELVVDPERRIARVGGGLTWAEVDTATQEHGLAAVGGRVSSTGVAGLTLGGGSGWLERKHGLACDNVLAVELITASGEPIRASADEHPELFWALRGGGGNFGVVTAIEIGLLPYKEVFAGATELTATNAVKGFAVQGIACPGANAAVDDIELTTTGGTTLRYDSTGGQFIQNWQTPKQAGACYKVTMTTQDGSPLSALFKLK